MRNKKFVQQQLRFWQFVVPATVLFLSVLAIGEMRYPLGPISGLLLWLSRMDPFLLIAHIHSSLSIPYWFWFPILVVLLTAFMGRFFCGWLCPFGALLNVIHYVRQLFHQNHLANTKDTKWVSFFKQAKYWWLALLVMLSCAGLGIVSVITPLTLFSHEITRLYVGQFPWLLSIAIILGFMFFPRFWCTYICPTGILFTLVAGVRRMKIRITDPCVKCNHCKNVCPVNAMNIEAKNSDDECLVCGRCWAVCSQNAIGWNERSKSTVQVDMKERRKLILAGSAILAGSLVGFSTNKLFATSGTKGVLRPPGAIPESKFLATCNRCGRCVKVCPTDGLVPISLFKGIVVYETPELVPRKGSCDLCMLCSKVCPTGAIQQTTVEKVKIGIAQLEESTCLAWASGKACLICKERCPANAIFIDENKRPYIDTLTCIGCGACENACPVEEAAVKVVPCQ